MLPGAVLLRNQSCSYSSMSIKTGHLPSSTARDCTTSSNVSSSGETGEVIAQKPARRRIVNSDCIFKHLGLKREGYTATKPTMINNEGKKSLPINSTNEDTLLNQLGANSTKDNDHKKGSHQFSEESFIKDENSRILEEYSLPTSFGKRDIHRSQKSNSIQNGLKHGVDGVNKGFKKNKRCLGIQPFDICCSESEEFQIKKSTYENHACRSSYVDIEAESVVEVDSENEGPKQIVLRPGMVLLKDYITLSEQVLIVNKCRELGVGSGGFYQPGYKDGRKLRLHMMCLGFDWDPETRKYQRRRQIDRSKPPNIPREFHQLIERAMQDSYALIRRNCEVNKNAQEILPGMTPDICIVNFYTENGRLGLHQDRDESAESLTKGLPVVSFSIGDSAEFLYGDQRDTSKAEKVVLNSGDVLIFGGESRHIFHGVSSIIPNSAPTVLLQQTGLRPARLNLTFRQL